MFPLEIPLLRSIGLLEGLNSLALDIGTAPSTNKEAEFDKRADSKRVVEVIRDVLEPNIVTSLNIRFPSKVKFMLSNILFSSKSNNINASL